APKIKAQVTPGFNTSPLRSKDPEINSRLPHGRAETAIRVPKLSRLRDPREVDVVYRTASAECTHKSETGKPQAVLRATLNLSLILVVELGLQQSLLLRQI